MSVDRISNMLSSLKNASLAGRDYVETFYTKELEGVAKTLKDEGYLKDVKVFKPKGKKYKGLRLEILYENDSPKIKNVKRLSKPGRRLYTTYNDITPVLGGRGVLVVSTSRGIMSGFEARKRKLGGELICKVF